MRLSLLPHLAALALAGTFAQTASAQITVDRETVLLNPANASERVAHLTVRNTGSGIAELSVQLEDWDVDAEGASHWRKSGVVAGACGHRIAVSPASLQLAPGAQEVVKVSLKSDAKFDAECWSAAVVRSTTGKRPPSGNATMADKTVPLFVTPSGLAIDGELSDMYVKNDSLEVIFRNTGKQRTNIIGEVLVQTPDETVVMRVPLDSATVLVGATRKFRVAMPKLPKGKYVLVAVVDFGGDQLTAVQAALETR
jgi:hypothetical protein